MEEALHGEKIVVRKAGVRDQKSAGLREEAGWQAGLCASQCIARAYQ